MSTYLDTNLSSTIYRAARTGLNYEYRLKLRKNQKERLGEVRLSQEVTAKRTKQRKLFLFKNVVNQRWPMSLQATNTGYGLNVVNRSFPNSSQSAIKILAISSYHSQSTTKPYVKELIKIRVERAAQNREQEFRNPLFVPLRGLDEDENDRDYMNGKEIRRELRNSVEFEEMFDKYVCEREEVDRHLEEYLRDAGFGGKAPTQEELREGLTVLHLQRTEGEEDQEFFERCWSHCWSIIRSLEKPTIHRQQNEQKSKREQKEIKIKNLVALVEAFKIFYRDHINNLDDALIGLALSLQLLSLNRFWKDLRNFMRAPENDGLKSLLLVAGLQSDNQLIQEALIELVYDLSFSDFECQVVNRILYSECRELLDKWLGTLKWNSEQTLSCFLELVEDLFLSQAVFNKPKEEKEMKNLKFKIDKVEVGSENEEEKEAEGSDSEEEKQIEHEMEDVLSKPLTNKLTPQSEKKKKKSTQQQNDTVSQPRIYYRKDDQFLSFLSSIFYHLLNISYQIKSEAKTVDGLLDSCWTDKGPKTDSAEGQESERQPKKEELDQEEETLDEETLKQLQLEDDGIEMTSETTTECSEYSDDIFDEGDIDTLILKPLRSITYMLGGQNRDNKFYKQKMSEKYMIYAPNYEKNEKISDREFATYLDNWVNLNKPKTEERFPLIDRLSSKFYNSQMVTIRFLTFIKFNQFRHLDGKGQVAFLNKMDRLTIGKANFLATDFAKDIILEILAGDIRNAPQTFQITDQRPGKPWNNFFYKRPYPLPGITTEEQYKTENWVEAGQNYEKAIGHLHRLLTTRKGDIGPLAKFLNSETSMNFSFFIRSMLKTAIGHPLKTIRLGELKREDFTPYKIDRGYQVIELNLADIEYGDVVYTYQKTVFDSDFIRGKKFYVQGRDSICTRTDIKLTRDELIEHNDEYEIRDNVSEGSDDEDGLALNAFNQRRGGRQGNGIDFLRQQNQAEHQDGAKGDKDRPDNKKAYLLKKYSILSLKKRKDPHLVRSDKFDKLDNRVCLDMLRSGAAIIRKLRIFGAQRQGFRGTEAYPDFIRRPLYLMYVPTPFPNNELCKKFSWFMYKHFHMNPALGIVGNVQRNYDCLYVRRLKKVVLRPKDFNEAKTKHSQMLALERVLSDGKVVNFDDPEQREPYYNRLFKLKTPFTKSLKNVRYIDLETHIMPRIKAQTQYFCLLDFTTRQKFVAKSNFAVVPKNRIKELNLRTLPDGETFVQTSHRYRFKKVMKKGQESKIEIIPPDDEIPYYEWNFDRYNNDVVGYGYIAYNSYTNKRIFDPKTGLAIFYKYLATSTVRSGRILNYDNKTLFRRAKGLSGDDRGGVFFYVKKNGSKKVFRFALKVGTLIAVEMRFRRVYLVDLENEKVELRVLSIDAINKAISNYL